MKEILKKRKTSVILASIITIALGIVLIIKPVGATVMICRVAGFLLLMSGLFVTGSYFLNMSEHIGGATLIIGLIQLALGLWVTLRSENFVQFLTFIVGFVVLVHSFGFFQNAFELKRLRYSFWWILLIIAVITLIFGIITVAAPFETVAVTMTLAGISLVFDGISSAVAVWKVDKFVRSVREAAKGNVIETNGEDISGK